MCIYYMGEFFPGVPNVEAPVHMPSKYPPATDQLHVSPHTSNPEFFGWDLEGCVLYYTPSPPMGILTSYPQQMVLC